MFRSLAAITIVASLTACSAAQMAATGTRAALSPETAAKITGLCRQAQPLLSLASFVPSATVHEVSAFVSAYCGQMLAGAVPPTTDTNTESWLVTNIATLRAALR